MNEVRVYVVKRTKISENITTKEFVKEAESEGRVYSLNRFMYAFNDKEINPTNDIIKILTTKCYK